MQQTDGSMLSSLHRTPRAIPATRPKTKALFGLDRPLCQQRAQMECMEASSIDALLPMLKLLAVTVYYRRMTNTAANIQNIL